MSSPKFIRLSVGGTPTLVNVTDVTTVTAVGAAVAQAATLTITYASGGNTLLTTAATAADNFLVAAQATVVQAFWNIIADAVAQPWNQPIIPSNGTTAVLMTPATSQDGGYLAQDADPAGSSTFEAKQSSQVLNQGDTPLVFLTAV
jgi:hypothetical protein